MPAWRCAEGVYCCAVVTDPLPLQLCACASQLSNAPDQDLSGHVASPLHSWSWFDQRLLCHLRALWHTYALAPS